MWIFENILFDLPYRLQEFHLVSMWNSIKVEAVVPSRPSYWIANDHIDNFNQCLDDFQKSTYVYMNFGKDLFTKIIKVLTAIFFIRIVFTVIVAVAEEMVVDTTTIFTRELFASAFGCNLWNIKGVWHLLRNI